LSGSQAKDLKLVDAIGGFDVAVAVARELAGIPEGKERVGYPEKSSLTQSLSDRFNLESRLDVLLPSAELSGIPLWRMPQF
jgi:ClpP class serine protease